MGRAVGESRESPGDGTIESAVPWVDISNCGNGDELGKPCRGPNFALLRLWVRSQNKLWQKGIFP
jgi:hypothetical protein